jgi:uncharacterized protein YcsI (UPF0317 family)
VRTAGWCAGWAPANLVAVPEAYAYDLLLFGQRNPKPCPVLDVSDVGVRGPVRDRARTRAHGHPRPA